jgi:drug/metabolite transporter (DMT)-like permease
MRPKLVESPVAPRVRLHTPGNERRAAIMLLGATFLWGFSFVWVKEAVAAINAAAQLPNGAAFGPALLMSVRFMIAGIVWLVLFRRARVDWTRSTHWRSMVLGVLLGVGLLIQTVGLDLTSEAVSAFLTSLAVLFVPLLVAIVYRTLPSPMLAISIVLAVVGVYMLTGASLGSIGYGEWMGIACSVVFSIHLLALNRLSSGDTPWRLCAGQFLWVGITLAVVALIAMPSISQIDFAVFATPLVWGNLLLLVAIPTLISFGLATIFQPQIDPTRAAVIYLLEPIFASAIAWVLTGRGLQDWALIGAGMILLANVAAELGSRRPADVSTEQVPSHDPPAAP